MKQKNYFFICLIAIFITFYSCSTLSDSWDNYSYLFSSYSSPLVLRINSEDFKTINTNRLKSIYTGDSFKINSVEKIDDILEVSVSYGGGCKQHSFEIIWDGIVYTDAPSNINLFIIHDAKNDNCEALVTESLSINLKDLIGDNTYKDSCIYNIFTSYNTSNTADFSIEGSN